MTLWEFIITRCQYDVPTIRFKIGLLIIAKDMCSYIENILSRVTN